MDKLAMEFALREARRQVESRRQSLIDEATALSERMAALASKLKETPDRRVNELGEVQGRGMDVDRLCALLVEAQNQVKMLEALFPKEAK